MTARGELSLPSQRRDFVPVLLVPLVALVALPLVGSPSTWVTLTLAGLAMGMIIFIIASGLTLVFGLMDVLNFGHGAFITVGAYAAAALVPLFAASLRAEFDGSQSVGALGVDRIRHGGDCRSWLRL